LKPVVGRLLLRIRSLGKLLYWGGKVMEELKARLGERARLDPMGKTFHPDIPLNELYGPYLERRLAVRDSILVDGGLLLSH